MVADNIAITDMVDLIDRIALSIGIDIPNEKLNEFQNEIRKALLDIDVTMYYQLLDLYEDVETVRLMISKYNLLMAEGNEKVLTNGKKIEILGFILNFARKIGNDDNLYRKIERDYEFVKDRR